MSRQKGMKENEIQKENYDISINIIYHFNDMSSHFTEIPFKIKKNEKKKKSYKLKNKKKQKTKKLVN